MASRRAETVVITGASAGVGRATVREFAKAGANIALIARGRERLEAAAREVHRACGRALVLPLDVADHAAVEAAADRVERELGPIDIWVNNAMATVVGTFMSIPPDEFRRATEVTYLGQVHGLRAALKHMLPRNRGTIVLVGSALAYRGIPLQSPYCGAKHAVQGLLDSVRAELIHRASNVHVTMVQLPALNTPQFDWARVHLACEHKPVGAIFQPEVAARAIYFAAHARRKEVKVGWSTVEAILADKAASAALDRYLAETAFKGQEDPTHPIHPGRPDNLFKPVSGNFAAHGRFNDAAKLWSPQLWLTMNRLPITIAAILAGVLFITRRRRSETEHLPESPPHSSRELAF